MAPAPDESKSPPRPTAGKEAAGDHGSNPETLAAGEMSPSVGTKRRRAERAQRTLTRPFKSPLKTRSPRVNLAAKDASNNEEWEKGDGQGVEHLRDTDGSPTEKENKRMKPNPTPIAVTPDKKNFSASGLLTHSISSSPLLSPSLARRVVGVHGRPSVTTTSTSSLSSLSPLRRLLSPMKQSPRPASNPQLVTLQRQHSNVQRSLNSARTTLDLLQQATRIEKQKQDEQLQELTIHWRQIAQRAAEEVFTGAKERVDRMGGIKAWKEMSNGKNNPGWGWDVDIVESKVWTGEADGESEADVEEAKEKRKAEIEDEFEKELDADGDVFNDIQEEEEEEEEELTMDMMLKILNVDLKVIGYDKETQKWR